jgi:scyllo-inositol 2-dehydrogenase (NADP+)
MKNNINVAVLGFGLSGSTFHTPLINATDGLNLTHILSSQKDKIAQVYPTVTVVDTLSEILINPDINLVVNTLPNSKHYEVTKQCLLAGKHVIVEKPFVIGSRDGIELIDLAQKHNLMLSVYHNRRWDNGFLTLKRELPKLGKIYLYESYFDRFRPAVNLAKWREQDGVGSGILYDLGSHLIDQAIDLFGMPTHIFADLEQQRLNSQAVDYFQLTLFYPQHRVILGSNSVIANPRPIIAAYGEQASYVKHGLDTQESMLKSGLTPLDTNYGSEDINSSGIFSSMINDTIVHKQVASELGCYQQYYSEIYDCLINHSKIPVNAESALNTIKIIEAAKLSNELKSAINISE